MSSDSIGGADRLAEEQLRRGLVGVAVGVGEGGRGAARRQRREDDDRGTAGAGPPAATGSRGRRGPGRRCSTAPEVARTHQATEVRIERQQPETGALALDGSPGSWPPWPCASSSPTPRRCSPTTARTATGWWPSASCASWPRAATSCTSRPRPSTCATAPPAGLHVHRLRARAAGRATACASWPACGGCSAACTRRRPFDLVHQLNPVDVGLSLAVADVRAAGRAGPVRARLAAHGRRRRRGRLAAPSLRVKRAAARRPAAPRGHGPAVDARGRGEARGLVARRACASARCRPASTRHAGRPPADPAARDDAEDVLFLANLQVRKGILVVLDAFDRVAAQRPAARLLVAGDGPEAGDGAAARGGLARRATASCCSARVDARAGAAASCRPAACSACPPTPSPSA